MEPLFGLLRLAVVGEKLKEVVEVIDRHFQPFNRGSEAAGVKPIAVLMVACGEVVEGEVKGVAPVDRRCFDRVLLIN